MKYLSRVAVSLLSWGFSLLFTLLILGGVAAVMIFNHYAKGLPDYGQLAHYDPPTVTRLYAADGRLLAEYATEKRVFVPLSAIPKRVRQAFISAEDKNFYEHTGIDFSGIARAVRDNVVYYGQGKSLVGGSTITQQVVKNFLLSNEKSIERKIKEAILALRISHAYSKDKILELYLNEIYLGGSSYGVAAAAQNYFNKSLDELTIEEAALLAAQPKAPSLYNPRKNYDAAKHRRDWVVERMLEDGAITPEEAADAKASPINLRYRDEAEVVNAEFFAEEVRRELAEKFGANVLYEGGLVVRTTIDPVLQKYADNALRMALIEYDRRHGYRGPVKHLPKAGRWEEQLKALPGDVAPLLEGQKLAAVATLDDKRAHLIFADGAQGVIAFSSMKWTRRVIADGVLGPEIKKPGDVLRVGDVVLVGPLPEEQRKGIAADDLKKSWDLQQVPQVNGAMVALDPHTGRVLAMSGGYAYGGTEFNRATQAKRQPGSAFKPFVYLSGLENGFTPSTVLLDAPVEMSQGAGLPAWKPQNYKDEYLGPATMRVGLEKSRNTMTVRLAQMIGIDNVLEISKRFEIYADPPRNFSIVLGASETTLLKLVNAYGMIVNGGKRIDPALIERIDDRHGATIFRRDTRSCNGCIVDKLGKPDEIPPLPKDDREQVLDPRVAYQMTSMLQGVVERGTATRAKILGRALAGKTGTTNASLDTWFVGFSPDMVAGVYIGYDKPRTLGKKETGASVALPAFIDFMKHALKDVPETPFRIPRGIQLVKVDLHTGLPPSQPAAGGLPWLSAAAPPLRSSGPGILEAFITGGPIYVPGRAQEPYDEEKALNIAKTPPQEAQISVDPPESLQEDPRQDSRETPDDPPLPPIGSARHPPMRPVRPGIPTGTGGLY